MKYLLILWLMTGATLGQLPPLVLQNMQMAVPVAAVAGEYLLDRSYFKIATSSNSAPMAVIITDGATDTTIDWGDGNTTTVTTGSAISYTNTYATAGTYTMTVRGGATTVSFYHALANAWLRQMLTPFLGLTNMTSLSFRDCNLLTNSIPSLDANTNLTSLASAFLGCTGLSGSIPSFSANTKLTTLATAFYNCAGLSGSIPSLSANTNLTSLSSAFQGCTGLSGSIPSFSANTKLTTLAGAFNTCAGLSGSIPSLSANTNLTSLASAFNNCTGLSGSIPSLSANTNLTSLSSAFQGCTGLSGSIPSLSENTSLTTLANAFYGCTGLLGNTNTVAGIFGTASRTNLTTANSCFWIPNGSKTNLLGNASDFIGLAKSPSFTTNIYSTNGSYRMFYFQTNLTDYATMAADWK